MKLPEEINGRILTLEEREFIIKTALDNGTSDSAEYIISNDKKIIAFPRNDGRYNIYGFLWGVLAHDSLSIEQFDYTNNVLKD